MRYFSSVFTLVGIAILLLEIIIFNNHYDIIKRDYDSAVLAEAIEYASEAAFSQSLQTGHIGGDYTDMNDIVCDPTNTLETFNTIMCLCYDMALTEENKNLIENSIDTAVLVNNDGYYITWLSEIVHSVDLEGVDLTTKSKNEIKTIKDNIIHDYSTYEYRWSPKLPFSYDIKVGGINDTIAFNLVNRNLVIYDNDTEKAYPLIKGDMDASTGGYIRYNGTPYPTDVVNDLIKVRVSNDKLSDAINYNISKVTEIKGGSDYTVMLPSQTTSDGLNPVLGNSFLVVISHADYAGKARLNDAVLSGLRATDKIYYVGFKDKDGVKRYCKNGQIPMSDGIKPDYEVIQKYLTADEAVRDGYAPHYEYLQIPLIRK